MSNGGALSAMVTVVGNGHGEDIYFSYSGNNLGKVIPPAKL